jgi:hypothetical protein
MQPGAVAANQNTARISGAGRGLWAATTGFAGRQSYAHTSDTSQILPRSWGLAVRELLLAARPKFTEIYVGNGLRFAEIRLMSPTGRRRRGSRRACDVRRRRPVGDQRIRLWPRLAAGPLLGGPRRGGGAAARAAAQPPPRAPTAPAAARPNAAPTPQQ